MTQIKKSHVIRQIRDARKVLSVAATDYDKSQEASILETNFETVASILAKILEVTKASKVENSTTE